MKPLRNYGIYRLPGDQRSLYFVRSQNDDVCSCALYDCQFGRRLPPRFRVEVNGNIVNWFGDFPYWTTGDLIDTGETYEEQANGSQNSNSAEH